MIDMKKQLVLLGGLLAVGGISVWGCEETGTIHGDRAQLSELNNGVNCYSHEQCKSKFCKADKKAGICADKILEGNPCGENDLCADELVCKADVDGANKCLKKDSENVKPGLNQNCTSECASEYVCEESEEDEALKYCKVNIGNSCNDTNDCVRNAECAGITDKKCLIRVTKSCTEGQHETCISGFCKKGKDDTYTCENKIAENTPCSLDNKDICAEGLECRLDRADSTNETKCLPILPDLGEDCTHEAGCKDGLTCQAVSDTENKCKGNQDHECTETDQCIEGLLCKSGVEASDPKTCQLPGLNEACNSETGCEEELACNAFSDVDNENKFCKVAANNRCTGVNDCIWGYECKKSDESDDNRVCLPFSGKGEKCILGCADGYVCEIDSFDPDSESHCKVDKDKNCLDDDECIRGYECTGEEPKICTKIPIEEGGDCANDEECESNYCKKRVGAEESENGICRLFPVGHDCSSNKECNSLHCVKVDPNCRADNCAKKCAADQCEAIGLTCDYTESCRNGICVNDVDYSSEEGKACSEFQSFCKDDNLISCVNDTVKFDDCTVYSGMSFAENCHTIYKTENGNGQYQAYCPVKSIAIQNHCIQYILGSETNEPFDVCYGENIIAQAVCGDSVANRYGIVISSQPCPENTKCSMSEITLGAECK